MIVYSYFDPTHPNPAEQAEFVRLFARTWRRHGWTPRLLTPRDLNRSTENLPVSLRALLARRGGWFADLRLLNLGFPPIPNYESHCYGDGTRLLFLKRGISVSSALAVVSHETCPIWPDVRIFNSSSEAARCCPAQ